MLGRVTTPQNLDERFRDAGSALQPSGARRSAGDAVRDGTTLTGARALELFDAQLASRHLDLAARWLRSFNEGFYTIGSSGHEGNAAVAAALLPTDPALLHYRSAAFFCARAKSLADAAQDVLRGVGASTHEPIAGGRHKVFGSADLNIVPTTSTVASHLPRAVGLAFSLARPAGDGHRGGHRWPADAIVAASFGDASANHATARRRTGRCRRNPCQAVPPSGPFGVRRVGSEVGRPPSEAGAGCSGSRGRTRPGRGRTRV